MEDSKGNPQVFRKMNPSILRRSNLNEKYIIYNRQSKYVTRETALLINPKPSFGWTTGHFGLEREDCLTLDRRPICKGMWELSRVTRGEERRMGDLGPT